MLVSGVASVWAWKQFEILEDYYEGSLGILVGLGVYAVGTMLARGRAWSGQSRPNDRHGRWRDMRRHQGEGPGASGF